MHSCRDIFFCQLLSCSFKPSSLLKEAVQMPSTQLLSSFPPLPGQPERQQISDHCHRVKSACSIGTSPWFLTTAKHCTAQGRHATVSCSTFLALRFLPRASSCSQAHCSVVALPLTPHSSPHLKCIPTQSANWSLSTLSLCEEFSPFECLYSSL